MKAFAQFVREAQGTGGSPYQDYKAPKQPEPSSPPPGWKEKYIDPLKNRAPVRSAQLAPQKPPLAPGVPLNLDNPAEKLRRLQIQRKEPPTV